MHIGETECFGKRSGPHCTFTIHCPVPRDEVFTFAILEYEDDKKQATSS